MKRQIISLCIVAMLSACATSGNPHDPLEGYNRAMFSFNDTVDKAVLKPVAQVYEKAPLPTKVATNNFFSNLSDLWVGLNNFLQGKGSQGANDIGRFLINSTVGILGLFDVASEAGLEKHDEDFGQTLAVWGMPDGPFIVLPLLGPRTLRDGGANIVDTFGDPVRYVERIPVRNSLTGLRVVKTRAELLPAERALNDAALDRYSYYRDFYLQRRHSLIQDGKSQLFTDDPMLDE